mmetsp:Transcript_39358/g.53411  ORF Transcript_39358/g.53411 Transcript_39358/m.53411 type:complete len:368 (-) Transcript_39358:462-1565(-)
MVTLLAFCAKRRDPRDSFVCSASGTSVHSMRHLPNPVRQPCKRYVSFESRKGICWFPLASAEIVKPNALSDLLMDRVSLCSSCWQCLLLLLLLPPLKLPDDVFIRSLPARSQKFTHPLLVLLRPPLPLPPLLFSLVVTGGFVPEYRRMQMQWLREDASFISVAFVHRCWRAFSRTFCASVAWLTWRRHRPSTYTSPFSRSTPIFKSSWCASFSTRRSRNFSLRISTISMVQVKRQPSSLDWSASDANICSQARNTIPLSAASLLEVHDESRPSIVKLFPELVCPYAKMHSGKPSTADCTSGLTCSYNSSCDVVCGNVLSKLNSCDLLRVGMFTLCTESLTRIVSASVTELLKISMLVLWAARPVVLE